MNNIEFIKKEFGNYYKKFDSFGELQGIYEGADTNVVSCMFTLTKMIKPKNVLEIGSWIYKTSDSIGNAMDQNGFGVVDSLDIKYGGYDGKGKPKNNRVRDSYWYPNHTNCDRWKYEDDGIVFKDFKELTNEEIYEKNYLILKDLSKDFNYKYDMIFIDGDHSYEGLRMDYEIIQDFCHDDTLVVMDNIWDSRFGGVRKFFDEVDAIKWDFKEWNDEHYITNMVQDTGIIQKIINNYD